MIAACSISIGQQLLPEAAAAVVARGDNAVRCWSAGCASGEEPYTLVLVWRFCVPQDWPTLGFSVIATDAENMMIERAKAACYARSSLKDLPPQWVEQAFTRVARCFASGRNFVKASSSSCGISGDRCLMAPSI